jgi:hypothetical protein
LLQKVKESSRKPKLASFSGRKATVAKEKILTPEFKKDTEIIKENQIKKREYSQFIRETYLTPTKVTAKKIIPKETPIRKPRMEVQLSPQTPVNIPTIDYSLQVDVPELLRRINLLKEKIAKTHRTISAGEEELRNFRFEEALEKQCLIGFSYIETIKSQLSFHM